MQNWQRFIKETHNTKIPIFEIDIPAAVTVWLNDSPGIWKYTYRTKRTNTSTGFKLGSFTYGSFKGGGVEDTGINSASRRINSLIIAGVNYSRMNSLKDCKRTIHSFYFDAQESLLYVNFADTTPYIAGNIKAGVTRGFATQDIYLDDIYYEPRIKKIPQVSIGVDDTYYGIRRYSSGSVSLINDNGHFDDFVTDTIFGQECRIKLGGTLADGTVLQYDDYKTLFTGYVQRFDTRPSELLISIGDKKDKIGKSLPVNFFSSTDYPDIKDSNDGKPIPLAWGPCMSCPCVCVNEEEAPTPANYKFVIADITNHSIKTLSKIYINGEPQSSTPTLVNDATDDIAYFNIASGGNYSPGQTVAADIIASDNSVLRDGSGTTISNALDQVKDIFNDYLGITYNASNFNLDNWDNESAKDYEQGIYIGDNTKISEVLEKTAIGHLGVFFVDGAGLWNFKTIDDDDNSEILITTDEIFNEPVKVDDGKKYLTSATVKYKKSNADGKYKSKRNTTYESDTFNTYGLYRDKDFISYLSDDTEATALSEKAMLEFKSIKSEYEILTTIKAADLTLYKNINAVINRMTAEWIGPIKARVMGIKYYLSNPVQVGLSIKYIEAATADIIPDTLLITKNENNTIVIVKKTAGVDLIKAVAS